MPILSAIHYKWVAGNSPDCSKFRQSLTPENALEKLKQFNSDSRTIRAARFEETPGMRFEFLMNSFQYAKEIVSENKILDMARYLNECEVFNCIAPQFYGSTTWTRVFDGMFLRCPPIYRIDLLNILEDKGHMQGVIDSGVVSGHEAACFFFMAIAEGHSIEDAKLSLKSSISFSLAKDHKYFVSSTLKSFSEYKELLAN